MKAKNGGIGMIDDEVEAFVARYVVRDGGCPVSVQSMALARTTGTCLDTSCSATA
jgi:hypothetical protein